MIPDQVRDAMIAHAIFCFPEEACGLLAFDDAGRVRMFYALTNAEHSPVAGRRTIRFSAEALSVMQAYSWPGNVRALHNVVERALILADVDGEIRVDDLPGNLRHAASPAIQELIADRPTLEDLERAYIQRLLVELGGHRARVAEVLGISDRTLYRKLKRLPEPTR